MLASSNSQILCNRSFTDLFLVETMASICGFKGSNIVFQKFLIKVYKSLKFGSLYKQYILRELFLKYKSVTRFVLTFLIVYGSLSIIYRFYLRFSDGSQYYPDYMTHVVTLQTQDLLHAFGYNANVIPHPDEPSMKLMVNGHYLARIVEGCNSVSVIILFVSFVVAFSGQLRETIIFILSGSVLIYVVNLFRIVLLSIGLYHYPWRADILHEVVFPGIIYGMVFLLWMFWVNRFSKMKKKNE